MTAFLRRFLLAAAAMTVVTAPSHAQTANDGQAIAAPVRQYVFNLGVGAIAKPRYEAADSYLIYPFPIISVANFYLPGLGQVADGRKKRGVFVYPAFNFIGKRKASDSGDLTGTNTIDWALELGIGGGWRTENYRVFAELRQGINGHSGQVGQLGVDAIFYPTDKIEFSLGPRADFATGDYMDTYFGVTAAEAAASGGNLTAFNPSAGFKSVGVSALASYDLTQDVRLHLRAGYDRLIGDGAKSPIAKVGSKDQFNIGLGASYRFSFDLFN